MPIDISSTEVLNTQTSTKKKRSNKKRRHNRKSQSKGKNLEGNDTQDQSIIENPSDLNKLTPANLASLRWDNPLTDPTLENERIERYKELRRQRYTDARQQALQILIEQAQLTPTNDTTNLNDTTQQ